MQINKGDNKTSPASKKSMTTMKYKEI